MGIAYLLFCSVRFANNRVPYPRRSFLPHHRLTFHHLPWEAWGRAQAGGGVKRPSVWSAVTSGEQRLLCAPWKACCPCCPRLLPKCDRHADKRPNRIMGAEPNTRWPVSVGTRGASKTGENLLAWCVAHGWNDSLAPRAHERYAEKRFTRGALRHRTPLPIFCDASRHPAFPSFFGGLFRCYGTTTRLLWNNRHSSVLRACGPTACAWRRPAPSLQPDRMSPQPLPSVTSRNANLCHNWSLALFAGAHAQYISAHILGDIFHGNHLR